MSAPAPVSRIVGRRGCAHCGHPLQGQPIARDELYDIFIARCAECGHAAAVLDAPRPLRWRRRLTAGLAADWISAVLAAWIVGSLALWGLVQPGPQVIPMRYGEILERLHLEQTGGRGAGPGPRSFSTWWSAQDPAAVLDELGGPLAVIEWNGVWLLVPPIALAFAIGVFWAVLLHDWRGVRRFAAPVLISLPLMAMAGGQVGGWDDLMILRPRDAAMQQLAPQVLIGATALTCTALATGMLSGRMIGRVLLRATIPPTLRAWVAPLWLADGKRVQAPRREGARRR